MHETGRQRRRSGRLGKDGAVGNPAGGEQRTQDGENRRQTGTAGQQHDVLRMAGLEMGLAERAFETERIADLQMARHMAADLAAGNMRDVEFELRRRAQAGHRIGPGRQAGETQAGELPG